MSRQLHLLVTIAIAIASPSASNEINNEGPHENAQRRGRPRQDYHQTQGHERPRRRAQSLQYVDPLASVSSYLAPLERTIDTRLFRTLLDDEPSKIYTARDLLKALPVVSGGIAGLNLYLGEGGGERGYEYGLVNLAAFLAQCMKETIQYDACDENNWDLMAGGYPVSNACGQLGQSYQDYHCPPGEEHMECPVDPNMRITATTNAKWYGAPAPFYCEPKDGPDDFTGKWNFGAICNMGWLDPPMKCEDYEGQKAGAFDHSQPVANRNGRTDVEGCCWWGRGVIQTTGICNIGKLNYYLGARAAAEGRDAKYAHIDFCHDPGKICSSKGDPELKWIAGFFYWMKDVQDYNMGGWNYRTELHKFVDGGMSDTGFIDAISGIVNRGCHNPPCATGNVDGLGDRRENFQRVLGVFCLPSSAASSSDGPATPAMSPEDMKRANGILHRLNSHRSVLERDVLSSAGGGDAIPSSIYTFDALLEGVAYAAEVGYGERLILQPPATQGEFDYHQTLGEQCAEGLGGANGGAGAVPVYDFDPKEAETICSSQSAMLVPLLSTGCRHYASCTNGEMVSKQTCPDGLLFDMKIMACNWKNVVDCVQYEGGGTERGPTPISEPDAEGFFDMTNAGSPGWPIGLRSFEDDSNGPDLRHGLVNIAAFLAQSQNEGIKADACANPCSQIDGHQLSCPRGIKDAGCPSLHSPYCGVGALMTKRCMYGRINYFMGRQAFDEGRATIYPDLDACQNIEYICDNMARHPAIVWNVALLEWVERIQAYDDGDYNYGRELAKFVDGGMIDASFIASVSRIVVGESLSNESARQRSIHFLRLLEYLQIRDDDPSLSLNAGPGAPTLSRALIFLVVATTWLMSQRLH